MLSRAHGLLKRPYIRTTHLIRMSHSHTVPLPGGIPADHREHTESTTTILVPNENIAFLNPVQQYNRDLSVAVIRAWNEMRKEEAEAKAKAKAERGGGRKRKGKGKIEAREHAVAEKDEGAADEPEAGPSTLVSCQVPTWYLSGIC